VHRPPVDLERHIGKAKIIDDPHVPGLRLRRHHALADAKQRTQVDRFIKPRSLLTARQVGCAEALKAASTDFVAMRGLAMRFRGLLRSGSTAKLKHWLEDARLSGVQGTERFARTLRQDIAAVENAATQIWSNGQVEGQINRLKTLKRAVFGRAGIELLRARMLPLSEIERHQM
jgi:transposase